MYPIPDKALASHIAILGKTGSGKTWAAKGLVERVLEANGRACVIDPTGVWYGLRSSASGKSAGYPVAIFGGEHADFPLAGTHGEAIAEIVATSSTPAIVDTSLMKVGERTRFFADFGDAIVRRNKGPLHLVVDEAHLFAPQGRVNDPQSGAMLHAANNMVSLGRSRGLRIVLISQRPAKLHKDSLTQVETLIAMRLIAPQDRRAVEDWISDNADPAQGREIMSSLATLKTGHAWLWAPELELLERVSFPKIRTLDTGAAPGDGAADARRVLAPIDREAITARLGAIATEAEANDPKKLRARIAELERQVAYEKRAAGTAEFETLAEAERRGRAQGLAAAAGAQRALLSTVRTRLAAALEGLEPIAPEIPAGPRTSSLQKVPEKSSQSPRNVPAIGDGADLSPGQRKVLTVLIQYPQGVTREQLTVLAGYKRSTRDLYLQQLARAGLVETSVSGELRASPAGVAALPDAEPLPTGEELRQHWLARLPEGERKVLEALIAAFPNWIERDELGRRAGYLRSTRDLYVQRLQRRQLVRSERGSVSASETLF